jgi:serine/threonine protein kinase
VVHKDIKSSNIMLYSSFNAILGDFGLARLVDHVKGSQTTVLASTTGYMAPECAATGNASKESNVYSFGIVALEIACGRKLIKLNALEGQVVMVEWAWELYGIEKLLEAVHPRLSGDFDEQQMEHLMIVGLWCVHPDRNLRPSIRQTIHVLNFEAPLPVLHSPNMSRLGILLREGIDIHCHFQCLVFLPIMREKGINVQAIVTPIPLCPPHLL